MFSLASILALRTGLVGGRSQSQKTKLADYARRAVRYLRISLDTYAPRHNLLPAIQTIPDIIIRFTRSIAG